VCNPRLTLPEGKDRNLDDSDEGCLSFPGAFVACTRPDWARVDGVDHTGTAVAYEGKGLLARCLQHETDHVFGTVFGDRLPKKLRDKLRQEHEGAADDFPDGWPVGETAEHHDGENV
jgi:peptide deformylase